MTNELGTEQTQDGPSTAREALDEFKKVQSRRVAHWKEYDEALEIYERTNLNADESVAQQDASGEQQSTSEVSTTPNHGCDAGTVRNMNGTASNHYHSVALPMTDAIFAKIVSLVTSGLLDCSHCVRAIETEIRTNLAKPDLATLVGKVQDYENKVLRAIVQRDQNKRIGKVEGRDISDIVKLANHDVASLRGEIQDLMDEINAELAEI